MWVGIEVACSERGACKLVGGPVCEWVLDWVGGEINFRKREETGFAGKKRGVNEFHGKNKLSLEKVRKRLMLRHSAHICIVQAQ